MRAEKPTLPAYRVEMTLQQDGTLLLAQLPFRAGQTVEVIVLPSSGGPEPANPYPLRGTPFQYDRPTEPVATDDWESLQ
jgi:hypothetical protein